MGKKRRHTVNSGMKAIYKKNTEDDDKKTKKNAKIQPKRITNYSRNQDHGDDLDYDDKEENSEQELFLKFDKENDDDDNIQVEGMTNVENVMDLGLDIASDSDDDDDDDDDDEVYEDDMQDEYEDERTNDGNDDDDDDEYYTSLKDKMESDKNNILNWGSNKKNYYHGDTADLEIGQDLEDAELEEEAGREVLKARLQRMDETDFYLDDENDVPVVETRKKISSKEEDKNKKTTTAATTTTTHFSVLSSKKQRTDSTTTTNNFSTISTKEKKRQLQKQHPELFPLLQHFRDTIIRPCVDETLVVQKALLSQDSETRKAVGTTPVGIKYLLTKSMLQMSAALNVCQYLLIKADMAVNNAQDSTSNGHNNPFQINFLPDDDGIQSHPVIERLNHLNILLETLEESVEKKVPDLKEQLISLRKASYLMQNGDIDDEDLEDDEEVDQDHENEDSCENDIAINSKNSNSSDEDREEEGDDNNDDISEESKMQLKKKIVEDFTVGAQTTEVELKRQILNEARFSLRSHEDDEMQNSSKRRKKNNSILGSADYLFGDQEHENLSNHMKAGKSLTSTLNTITQKMSGKKLKVSDPEAEVEDFEQAFALMDQDLGSEDQEEGELEDMNDDYDEDNELKDTVEKGFYSQVQKKSQDKKKMKSDLYAVAPKYPRLEEEIEGERPIGNAIMKNRGLKKHRPKLDRNPRVKKREQYRKAIIRRKGAVRDIRVGEGHKYGGEETGIKSNLSRSRKLGVK